jgi:hypothetical protein
MTLTFCSIVRSPPFFPLDCTSSHRTYCSFLLCESHPRSNTNTYTLFVQGLGSAYRSMSNSLSSRTVTGRNISPPHAGSIDVNRADSQTSLVSPALPCIALYCTVSYRTPLYCIALHCYPILIHAFYSLLIISSPLHPFPLPFQHTRHSSALLVFPGGALEVENQTLDSRLSPSLCSCHRFLSV